MSLAPGLRMGAYEIVALVGSGGMGEVYRARDPRLARDVAIKVLPATLTADTERLRRFEHEARAAAALNHPNILAIHDIGDGVGGETGPYVVSELLEGATLRERLHNGPLPVRKAIEMAIQVARGLAAAHDRGIVHRDLKPENVFVCEDGRVKILDFGLAKLTEREPALAGSTAVVTAPPDTLPGVVLGTIGYMAPEQVRGRPTDHRSDIFSFGTMLYEMLSGRHAFRGESAADTMTAILKEDPPDLPAVEPRISPALARIVDRCLEKSPGARFQSAGDLAFALEALTSHSGSADVATVTATAPALSRRRMLSPLAMLLPAAFAGGLGLGAWLFAARTPPPRAIAMTIAPPPSWTFATSVIGATTVARAPFAVSPDGRRVAYIASGADNKYALWVRPIDTFAPQLLPGTDDAVSPFWSPDSRFIAFFAGGKLKKVDVSGGPPVVICDAPLATDGAWSSAGVILFATISTTVTPLLRVGAVGGTPSPATTVLNGDTKHVRPSFLPDGQHFLFRQLGSGIRGPLYLGSIDHPAERTHLLDIDSTNALYSSGHLLFVRETTLMAQPFDLKKLKLTEDMFPVVESVQTALSGGASAFAQFSASDNGVLTYLPGSATPLPRLTWFDRAGTPQGTVGDAAQYSDLAMANDGKRATVSVVDSAQNQRDIWIVDLARGLRSRFTFEPGDEIGSAWSPDGGRVAYSARRTGSLDLYQRSATGTDSERLLLADAADKVPTSWSPDGRFLLYTRRTPEGSDIWVLPVTGADRKPSALVATKFSEFSGRFSPDGTLVAYGSNESGRDEVYVTTFPGGQGKWQVTVAGGTSPRWGPNGRELFFRELSGRLAAVAIQRDGASVVVGDMQPLFLPAAGGARDFYDVAPDGTRFLVNSAAAADPAAAALHLTVIVTWGAAVRK